ncbi:alkaline phosphatase family protein [Shewanella sp. 1_MG-2023]|uniref:alkaline phosphatase family protein n=1 Tax=unclassified Shewanella TaxID=196818 RepID=UPI0026E15111|nr:MULTISPECIES: alkaline phosphatase family protein [unclassified Shewanella]MDO6609868.1 alkaline phosphatase family protein [Shewanella sp. 7_MG-2023]MDO6769990.1 alkaline phosphatase family protein [Shewanella sp. 2_MG-2023]MDO6793054.1 alkaline phosphatase family protein [Shewanella sp. 1_MG-2023]
MNKLSLSLYALACMTSLSPLAAISAETPPKLILQITVDGLRGDLLDRYKHNFGDNGFKYLLDEGTHYTNAHYQHSNTETIVGHVSLATGATPSVHGMVGNVWYDRSQERLVYNVEDENYHMLSANAGVDKSTEIDPTQKTALMDGRSPIPMLSTTFSDELMVATNGQSKVYSVSVKDRGAISLAGHMGKAFWFSKSQGEFATSNYYYPQYPQWVNDWNDSKLFKRYSDKSWQLSLAKKEYTLVDSSATHKIDLAGFNNQFPHPYGAGDSKYFTTKLTLSPAGDELTADFAKTLLSKEALGQNKHTDFLAVSFSSNDYVVHMFGSNSLETEDNLLRLDKTLADLFSHVDKQVGLENTVIVLSADHGVPETAPHVHDIGYHDAGYFEVDSLLNQGVKKRLKQEFGLNGDVITLFSEPYIYLDRELIAEKNLSLAQVQTAIAQEVMKVKGVEMAITSTDIELNNVPPTRVGQLVMNNHHRQRSGDVYIVFAPRKYINDLEGLVIASKHGSPWRYDTHVPIIFAGYNIKGQRIDREVTPYDIAPTLSNKLRITQPSGATGQVLEEVSR